MKKLIVVPNFNTAAAKIIIAIKSSDTCDLKEKVLIEMIRLAAGTGGTIEQAKTLHTHMEKTISGGITYQNYRTICAKLTKAGIISRSDNQIILCKELSGTTHLEVCDHTTYLTKIQNNKNLLANGK